jgi:hypothetical protein
LRGDLGLVRIGSNETDGYIALYDKTGGESIKIFGFAGGYIRLYESVTVSGGDRNIILQDTEGRNSVKLGGQDALISAGDNGKAGALYLGDTEGRSSISLYGNTGDIVLKDLDGKHSFSLHGKIGGFTGLWIGANVAEGANKPGKIYLRDNEGNDSITLDGTNGLFIGADHETAKGGFISIRDSRGYNSIILDGTNNSMVLNDTSGGNSIVMDGAEGEITLNNADCAEDFEISDPGEAEPGTVMVIANQAGKLQQSTTPYDTKVVGVISGAGNHKPGLVLDRKNLQDKRKPLALVGKVYCKVDAQSSSIEIDDLLTTSCIPGHAMKATDPLKAFGAVIGKALFPLKGGLGIIPILIALQ